MKRTVCAHRIPDLTPEQLPDFKLAAKTNSRPELANAISSLRPRILIVNLDEPETLDTIVQSLEQDRNLQIVGLTSGVDVNGLISAQRAGCAQFSSLPIDPCDLVMALRRAVEAGLEGVAENMTVSVWGAMGGAGSTMLACNLAVELARPSGAPAALLDLDLEFGTVAKSFDVTPTFTVADLTSVGAVDSVLLDKAAIKLPCGVHLFARPSDLHQAGSIEPHALQATLREIKAHYQYAVLDLPRKLDPNTGAAIDASERLIMVIQLTVPSLDNAKRTMLALHSEGIHSDRIHVVVNRYRKNVHTCTLEMAHQHLGTEIACVIPSDYAAVQKAVDTGSTLAEKNPVRAAIAELAAKLMGRAEEEKSTERRSWLSSLRKGAKTPTGAST